MNCLKILLPSLAGVLTLTLAATADAHGSMKPEHGGIVQMVGETRFELVNGPTGIALYVKEEEEDVPSAGMAAKLTVTTNAGKTSTVEMAPAGGNKFEAKGAKIPAGSKVGVMLVNKATQARQFATFTLK